MRLLLRVLVLVALALPTLAARPLAAPTAANLFSDGFESGSLAAWVYSGAIAVQTQEVFSGRYAARATSSGIGAYAYKQLSADQPELYFRFRFKVQSRGSTTVTLARTRTSNSAMLVSLNIKNDGLLGYRNHPAAADRWTKTTVVTGVWHDAQLHVRIAGTSSLVELFYDGSLVASRVESLGTTGIRRLQIGDDSGGRSFDVAFDEVVAGTEFQLDTGTAPSNTISPTISGDVQEGQALTAAPGTWSGNPAPAFSYQWLRCDGAGQACAPIADATASSYALTTQDVGATLRVAVTGTNVAGSATANSSPTAIVQARPQESPLFDDGFESGSLAAWVSTGGVAVQTQEVFSGRYAARATSTGKSAYAYVQLSADQPELYLRFRFKVQSRGSTTVTLARTRTSNAAMLVSLNIKNDGLLGYRNHPAAADRWTGKTVVTGVWHDAQLHVRIAGTSSLVELSYDGSLVASRVESLGTTGIRRLQIGDDSGGRSFDVAFDDIAAAARGVPGAPLAPASIGTPAIAGTAAVGRTLTATAGTWSGTPPLAYGYQWRRCSGDGLSCADLVGATSQNYAVVAADVDSTLRAVVTATNAAGSESATSAQTAVVLAPPANTTLPTISGDAWEGQTLTADRGTWSGSPPLTYGYQWRRCGASGASCSDIAGATGPTYGVVGTDADSTLRVVVTATNSVASATATSLQTAPVATAPANSEVPTISGAAQDGNTLTANPGTWSGTLPLAYGYQWRRCDADGQSCVDIEGATDQRYAAVAADIGSTLRIVVTAANVAGSASATSLPTAAVVARPANTAPPSISGIARDGETLIANRGTWSGTPPLAYGYQWRRCDGNGDSCVDVDSATSQSYPVVTADVSSTLRVVVTATNSAGSASATSAQTASVSPPVGETAPTLRARPTISGTAMEGETLSADPGGWSGTPPIDYRYSWERCAPLCEPVVGATAPTYPLGLLDVGSTLRVTVEASNGVGSATATSDETAVVTAPTAPANATAPIIVGTAEDGQTLTEDPGTWSGTPPILFATQWESCDAQSGVCTPIAGATAESLTLTAQEVGRTIRVTVTGRNKAGTGTASSAVTDVVAARVSTYVVMAAGDIACGSADSPSVWPCEQQATSDLLVDGQPQAVLGLGDLQYECGSLGDFSSFYDPTWGRLKAITYPAVGNHEYNSSFNDPNSICYGPPPGAEGYFTYFGAAASPLDAPCSAFCKGYYSFDLGNWHLIALNSNCGIWDIRCDAGSVQEQWLRADLAATSKRCILAYWHHPRFSSAASGNVVAMKDLWNALYDYHADVVLAGHHHVYERFDKLGAATTTDASGNEQPIVDAAGIREFIVGTGGKSHGPFTTIRDGSQVRDNTAFGVLKLTLRPTGYDWEFVPEAGASFTDRGSTSCH